MTRLDTGIVADTCADVMDDLWDRDVGDVWQEVWAAWTLTMSTIWGERYRPRSAVNQP